MGTIFLIPFIIAAVLKYLHYKGNKKVVDFFETEKGEKVRIGLWIYFWVSEFWIYVWVFSQKL